MSCSQFDEWFDVYLKEPWGYDSEVHRHSVMCSIMANGLFKSKTPYKCEDFRYPPKEEKPQTWQEMLAGMEAISGDKTSN